MLTYLVDIWENLISVIKMMSVVDYLDIIILSWLIYKFLRIVRETRADQLMRGIVVLIIVLLILKQFDFAAMSVIADMVFNVGIVAVIVMFQPELRRALEKVGRMRVGKAIAFNLENYPDDRQNKIAFMINEVCLTTEQLSRTATGALIVIEQRTKLGEQVDTGVIINATPSVKLLENLFSKNAPLHDGAVIIRDGMILAAGCFLPKPQNEIDLDRDWGSRHRAAIGMSENSDAIIIVVSEETGMISVAENGELRRGYTSFELEAYLNKTLLNRDDEKENGEDKKERKKRKKQKKSDSEKGAEQ